jgi:hypothetical protein
MITVFTIQEWFCHNSCTNLQSLTVTIEDTVKLMIDMQMDRMEVFNRRSTAL